MDRKIYIDLRCLQDLNYRVRGIGHHLTSLLRARANSSLSGCRTIGLTDTGAPQLPLECSSLVDEVSSSVNPFSSGDGSIFIDGTPMTHDPRFSLRILGHPGFLSAAVVYDFIPIDWPGYLPTIPKRIEYVGKLARLRNFDSFFPISEYTAWRLRGLLGISEQRIVNTGASVRSSVYDLASSRENSPSPSAQFDPYFLIVLADDPRKNPQVAIEAVRRLNLLYARRIALKVVGHYQNPYKNYLLTLAGHAEGAGFLDFCPEISDVDLVKLYRGAVATIASSHIEGFSLPVVEASVCGCPVIASSCAAHLELIDQPEALFFSTDHGDLATKLDNVLNNPSLREHLVLAQSHLRSKFHEDAVGCRFWEGLDGASRRFTTRAVQTKQQRYELAFLSPYPPQRTDAAIYTAMTMKAGCDLFHSDLYTDTPRPLIFEETIRDATAVSIAPLLGKQYNGIISVLGNSEIYKSIFEVFERFGGPCILHDVRLTQAYFSLLGRQGFLEFASGILRRPVSPEEVNRWVQDTDTDPPSLFVERILERASPLIVHTATQHALLKARYGIDAHVTTSCPSLYFTKDDLVDEQRGAARERLDLSPSDFILLVSDGATRAQGMDSCILALDFLRSWNIPAELFFVGDDGSEHGEMQRISELFRIAKHVHAGPKLRNSSTYRDFLLASDAAIQLRSYNFGAPSIAVSNCISAGLCCVTTEDAAASSDAPAYVSRVPDHFSPLQIAEQLASFREQPSNRYTHEEERTAYIQTHNFDYYCSRLMQILTTA